jgi:hypothetical protein
MHIRAAAEGNVGEGAVVAAAQVHLREADQSLAIDIRFPDVADGNPGADQVVVLVDARIPVETQPAGFAFNLNPAVVLQVHVGARANQGIGAGCRHGELVIRWLPVAGEVRLKDGGHHSDGE